MSVMEPGAEESSLRLEAELRLQPVERVDVRRIRDDEVPPLRGGLHALFAELDLETDARGVLAGERERLLRDVDARHPRVGPLVLHGERDRTGADADVEHARGLDALEEREHTLHDDLGLRPAARARARPSSASNA